MAGRTLLYGSAGVASSVNPVLLHNQRVPCSSSEPHDSIFMPASSASFLGSRSMVSFEDINNNGRNKRMEKTFYGAFDQEDNGGGEDDYDDYLRQPEKKRRLTVEQVQFLERSFELENKLEPERKIELAKELGLQPRQIAIWFQNRRARWKTKQLEKDYDALQTNYDKLKSDYDILLMEKDQLKAEVAQMTEKLLLKEKEKNGETAKDSSSFAAAAAVPDSGSALDGGVGGVLKQQEDLSSSAKSDVLDSDSPRYTDGGDHSSLLEQRGDSSYVFEPEQYSDLSQDDDEEVNISKNNPLRCPAAAAAACFFPKMEEEACYSDQPSSSYFGFPVDDQDQDHAFGFWQYN